MVNLFNIPGARGGPLPGLLFSLSVAAFIAGGTIALYLDPAPPIPSTITPLTGQELELLFASYDGHAHSDEMIAPNLDENGCEIYNWGMDQYQPANPSNFATGRVSFSVRVGEEVIPYPLMSLSVMPNEVISFSGEDARGRILHAYAERGKVESTGPQSWRWRAPSQQGMYSLRVEDSVTKEVICLHTFVMRPYDGGEEINGYRIGGYQTGALADNPRYRRPRGFIEVTPELAEAWVSPHFQLRQFLCKQQSDFPKYLAMSTRMLTKMEVLLEELNDRGIPATSFYIVSAYRTPWYNRQIGNASTFSRHTYGDAVDFLVDVNQDGLFDDIDRTGGAGAGDVARLRDIVTGIEQTYRPVSLVGGFGLYEPIPGQRGPFAHMDTRGDAARWVVGPSQEKDSVEEVEPVDSTLLQVLVTEESPSGKTPKAGVPGPIVPTDTPPAKDPSEEKKKVKPEAVPSRKSDDVEEVELPKVPDPKGDGGGGAPSDSEE